ncbi:MAG: hypothetical protein RLZZ507_104 [Cyanobacteriota bacterium]|jgi:hypothetical protein
MATVGDAVATSNAYELKVTSDTHFARMSMIQILDDFSVI